MQSATRRGETRLTPRSTALMRAFVRGESAALSRAEPLRSIIRAPPALSTLGPVLRKALRTGST